MNNYNKKFLYHKQSTSAHEVYVMSKQRNPIIETDKNIEKLFNENNKQTQLLSNVIDMTNKNAIAINNLAKQMQLSQEITDKLFKTSLIVSVVTELFAAGSFILTLIQGFK